MAEPVRSYRLRTGDGFEIDVAGKRLAPARGPAGLTVHLGEGKLRPGLINAHDHLQLNHYPRLGRPPYANAYDWGHDIHATCKPQIQRAAAFPRSDAYLFGALKNLLGGVTSVVHHDPWSPALNGSFPIHVVRLRVAHSLGFERDLPAAVAGDADTRHRPLSIHLAEGRDANAAEEIHDAYRRGLLDDQLIAVHLVGADPDGLRLLRDSGAAAVWCPTTNRFLLDGTAPPDLFTGGADILLGTDSLLTADGTMLEELREGARLGYLPPERLEAAVGNVAARRLGLPAPRLDPGAPADVVLLQHPLGTAAPRDVALVIVDGVPRLGDEATADLFRYCGVPTEPLTVGGVRKLVAAPLGAIAERAMEWTPDVARIFS